MKILLGFFFRRRSADTLNWPKWPAQPNPKPCTCRELVLYPYGRHQPTDHVALYLGTSAVSDALSRTFRFTIINQNNPEKSIATGQSMRSMLSILGLEDAGKCLQSFQNTELWSLQSDNDCKFFLKLHTRSSGEDSLGKAS